VRLRNEQDLGFVIRDRRKQLGMDQASLAARAGVSRQWIIEVERGKPRAEVGLILRILRVLDITLLAEEEPVGPSGPEDPTEWINIDIVVDECRKPQEED